MLRQIRAVRTCLVALAVLCGCEPAPGDTPETGHDGGDNAVTGKLDGAEADDAARLDAMSALNPAGDAQSPTWDAPTADDAADVGLSLDGSDVDAQASLGFDTDAQPLEPDADAQTLSGSDPDADAQTMPASDASAQADALPGLDAATTADAGADAGDAGELRCEPLSAIYVETESAVESIRGCKTIRRGLMFRGNSLPARVELPLLESIEGGLQVQAGSLQELNFPALRTFSSLYVDSPSLRDLRLPQLRSAGVINLLGSGLRELLLPAVTATTSLYVRDNPALTKLDLMASTGRLGTVELIGNASLDEVKLSSIPSVGSDVKILRNGVLTQVDLGQLRSVDHSIEVEANTELVTLELSALKTVGYNFSILGSGVIRLDLPVLVSVGADGLGGFVISGTRRLGEVRVPLLERVADLLYLSGNTVLTRFEAPKVNGADRLLIDRNSNLQRVELPAFIRVRELRVTDNLGLVQVGLPLLGNAVAVELRGNRDLKVLDVGHLERVQQDLRVVANPALTALRVPLLREVTFDLLLDDNRALKELSLTALERVGEGLYLADTAAERFDLPELGSVGDDMWLSYNPALTAIYAPLLRSVGFGLHIKDNPKLPACQARAVLAGLTTPPPGLIELPADPGNCP